MNLEEMKLAVCEKLPELIWLRNDKTEAWWHNIGATAKLIHWPTEGLQVCHEAEKKLSLDERDKYMNWLSRICEKMHRMASVGGWLIPTSTYEQRLEALCRVWWPERFKQCCCPPIGNDEACPVCVRN